MLDGLFDYTLRSVTLGSATLGLVSGALGTFAVLRRQSLIGDAISHAALPGIALAFLLTGTKSTAGLLLGAFIAGWLATVLVMGLTRTSRIKYDSALGLMLAVFFGFGLMLLTYIQKLPNANQAGLERFLFGQAAALVMSDVWLMVGLGAVALTGVALLWKELRVLAFDPEFGQSLGLPIRRLDLILTTLLVIAIVIGLQTVGVVLMSAMLIAPAAAARQWTDRLGIMVFLSMGFGAASGIAGAFLSSTVANLPTGPTIVLCASVFVAISMTLAPNRGLVWRTLREWRHGHQLRLDAVLLDLYALARQHQRRQHPHREAVLNIMSDVPGRTVHNLRELAESGLVRQIDATHWALTAQGLSKARTLAAEREGL
ncbi:MAG: iron chelate uptake ABC transporter family permease subunit [Rhodothermales bacterium]